MTVFLFSPLPGSVISSANADARKTGWSHHSASRCRHDRRLHFLRFQTQEDQDLGHTEEHANPQGEFGNSSFRVMLPEVTDLVFVESARQTNNVVGQPESRNFSSR